MNIDLGSRTTSLGNGEKFKTVATAMAVDEVSGEVLAHGDDADAMHDRTPQGVKIVRPIQKGAVTDLDMATRFIRLLWADLGQWSHLKRGIPIILTRSQLSRLEKNVLAEAVSVAGNSPVFVPNCLACAAGQGLDTNVCEAIAVINWGAETIEAAIFSQQRLLRSELLFLGVDELTASVQNGASTEFGVDLSWWAADQLRKNLGHLNETDSEKTDRVTARDRVSGLPVELKLAAHNVQVWMRPHLRKVKTFLRQSFSGLDPRVAADVCRGGILLSGGGALQPGATELVQQATGVETHLIDKPLVAGILGANKL